MFDCCVFAVCLFVWLFVVSVYVCCLFDYLCGWLLVYAFACLFVYLFMRSFVCLLAVC